jgi:hypothetical protein
MRRSIEDETLKNIAILIEYCQNSSASETPIKPGDEANDRKSEEGLSPQKLLEALYHTCIALEKDNQYLYALLARAEHKLRWHDDREIKQAAEGKIVINLLSNANRVIATLMEFIASERGHENERKA